MKMLEDLAEVVRYADDPSSRTDAAFVSALRFIRTHHAAIADMAKRLDAANALLLESDRYVFGNNQDLSVRIADHFNQAMQETGR